MNGRIYRIAYRCDPEGNRAFAYLLHSPWPDPAVDCSTTHLMPDDQIDIGVLAADLEVTIRRARTWCDVYSDLCKRDAVSGT